MRVQWDHSKALCYGSKSLQRFLVCVCVCVCLCVCVFFFWWSRVVGHLVAARFDKWSPGLLLSWSETVNHLCRQTQTRCLLHVLASLPYMSVSVFACRFFSQPWSVYTLWRNWANVRLMPSCVVACLRVFMKVYLEFFQACMLSVYSTCPDLIMHTDRLHHQDHLLNMQPNSSDPLRHCHKTSEGVLWCLAWDICSRSFGSHGLGLWVRTWT